MSEVITVELPQATVRVLDRMAKESHRSRSELIVMGLEALFDQQLDRKGVHLEDEEFDAVQDFLDRPVSPNVQEKLAKTIAREYPWEQQK